MKGKLIVFEGISGTGKETQAKLLQKFLATKHITSHVEYHPSLFAKDVLQIWRKERTIDHMTEAYILLADRYTRVTQFIKPMLEKGEWVISLRSYISALVYQAQDDTENVFLKKEFMRFEPEADYLFYFSTTVDTALQRINKRHNETGEALGKFENSKDLSEKLLRYKNVLRQIPHVPIDSSLSIEKIHEHLRSFISI